MKTSDRAFSRADLLFCLFALTLLFALAASLFASNKTESQRIVCGNNLRQIGRAFHVWGNDHDDLLPWQAPRSSTGDGGTIGNPNAALMNNAWFHYSWISNQLGSPKILVCPSDPQKRIATNWGNAPGGFLNVINRANSISYPIFLHAQALTAASLLSGDRNFRVDIRFTPCSYGVSQAFGLVPHGIGAWTNSSQSYANGLYHGVVGHLLFMDGSTRFTTSAEFQEAISAPGQGDDVDVHGLF
jgi:hypothetical protein